ncbi:MAG: PGF-pre-PGF domain-containing protein [Candidatus Hadarchaeota archaeon]
MSKKIAGISIALALILSWAAAFAPSVSAESASSVSSASSSTTTSDNLNALTSGATSENLVIPIYATNLVSFSPPHSDRGLDNDGDGKNDFLVIDLNVNVERAGNYHLGGSLYGGTTTYTYGDYTYTGYGSYVASAFQEASLLAGAQTIQLYFDGQAIKRAQINGPYTASFYIYDKTYYSYAYGEHTTSTYNYTQFGRALTGFSSPHSDSGLDTNSDGLYDYLEVTVNLNVVTAGEYILSGSLSGGSYENYSALAGTAYRGYTYIDAASKEEEFSTGRQSVRLRFDGSRIRQSKLNGPYTVYLALQKGHEWIESANYTTVAYNYTAFQNPAVSLSPPHSDTGVDSNGDGYYDYLAVDVKLNVTRAGKYSVSGSLTSGLAQVSISSPAAAGSTASFAAADTTTTSSTTSSATSGGTTAADVPYYGAYMDYAWNEAELSTGTQTVRLLFNGSRIRQGGIDGPYTVQVNVYGPHGMDQNVYSWEWATSDYGTHTTGTYQYTQFQPPAAQFSSPHSDQGSDTDGDGKHNYLLVNAKVSVTTPGKYRLSGTLMGGGSAELYAGTTSTAPVPASTASSTTTYAEASSTTTSSSGSSTTYSTVAVSGRAVPVYGGYVADAWTEVELSAGVQTVQLKFEGTRIYRSGTNGPYQVTVSLSDGNWNWLGYDVHTTSTYNYTDFQAPPISFSSPHSDQGLSTDSDNLFEYLAVDVKVDVKMAGTYMIVGTITPSYYLEAASATASTSSTSSGSGSSATADVQTSSAKIATATARYAPIMAMKRVSLGAGDGQTVQLRFPGGLIYQSGQNGPYQISLTIVDNFRTWFDSDIDFYTTSTAYQYTSFEQSAAVISPPHSDYGVDTDGDGLYNKLAVDVNLDVRTAGSFRVLGSLMSDSGEFIDREVKDATLQSGTQSVRLEFDGWKIYSRNIGGSMMIGILLLDPSSAEELWYDVGVTRVPIAGWMDADFHVTGVYSYRQFQADVPAFSGYARQPVGVLSAGQATAVDMAGRNIPSLKAVRVAAENAASPVLSVMEETEAPAGVPTISEEAISYITISVDNANGQSFILRLSKSRLRELNIDSSGVNVYRFEDNWAKLSTSKTGEDENYVYIEVFTPGFSTFAVTKSPAALPTVPTVQIPPIYLVAVAAVALIAVILVVIWRYISLGSKRISKSTF